MPERQRGARSFRASERRVGLARALSKLGFCSRSQATEMIAAGRVTLNGAVRRNAETPVRLETDSILVDGRKIHASAYKYLILNKPRGAVTTASDEKGRPTVYDYMNSQTTWLAPVGRLDKASEGLLLLTNDSAWAARILDPQTHVEKTYHVQIGALADETLLKSLKRGIQDGGELLRATKATGLRRGERNSWIEVVLDEGKNRQIRRMLTALGIEVLRLIRVAIGPVVLGDLPKGASRCLTSEEKVALERISAGNSKD